MTDPDAGSAVYRHDPAGNTVGIHRLPAGQVPGAEAVPAEPPTVMGFSPNVVHPGEAGDDLR